MYTRILPCMCVVHHPINMALARRLAILPEVLEPPCTNAEFNEASRVNELLRSQFQPVISTRLRQRIDTPHRYGLPPNRISSEGGIDPLQPSSPLILSERWETLQPQSFRKGAPPGSPFQDLPIVPELAPDPPTTTSRWTFVDCVEEGSRS